MLEAARLAPHLTGPAWILARTQTAARGRRGRAWRSPDNNFAATYLMNPAMRGLTGGPAQSANYSFVAALALHDALQAAVGPSAALAIKWPNDVLLNGGKIAGILLESIANTHLSIGIGVNLAESPPRETLEDRALPPVSLAGETGVTMTPDAFLDLLANAFARYDLQFRTYGFAPIRSAWLARAARLGQTITARTGTEERIGTFETIDDTGALILTSAQGRHAIAAADIYF
jgi:BirA family biotin operon repressor/biotin-[acetyl-CoA-carboxylase] ligase